MAKRAVAKGEARKRHELSIEAQGAFHYVYGPYAKPVLAIDPGDVVVVETEDAFGGVITSEKDSPTAKLNFPFHVEVGERLVQQPDARPPGEDAAQGHPLLLAAGELKGPAIQQRR